MARAFVASSAPPGWKLGRWSQASPTTWQEEKLENSKIVHSFQVVSGPSSFNGSTTVRLKMKDQNTEVMLLDASAQVFVNGSYFGEYGGSWETLGSKQSAASKQSVGQRAPAAAPAKIEQTQRPPSKQSQPGSALEQTQLPAQVGQKAAPQKAAPPALDRTASRGPAPAPAPAPTRPSITITPAPALAAAPKKADGLDKSAPSMEKLISAAKSGDNQKVSELLASGIDPDGPGPGGETPLMAAARAGHCAVVETLCAAFADPTMGKGEETPMTIAFQKGKQDILKVLFKASFDIMGPNAKTELTASNVLPEDKDVPDNATHELREVTKMIANISKGERPDSPVKSKYGNYAHMATNPAEDAEKDSDMMREQSVRLAMKSLVKTANAEITGLDHWS